MRSGIVVAISGPLSAGKSTLAAGLAAALPGRVLPVRQLLRELLGQPASGRDGLQAGGADLEARTRGAWLAKAVTDESNQLPDEALIVDAVRSAAQANALRSFVSKQVYHIHLTAQEEVRCCRYEERAIQDPSFDRASFDVVSSHPTEQAAEEPALLADLVIDTTSMSPEDVLRAALAAVHLQSPVKNPEVP